MKIQVYKTQGAQLALVNTKPHCTLLLPLLLLAAAAAPTKETKKKCPCSDK
jgi:hypothetical protein